MRVTTLLIATMALGTSGLAQDRPLADVARETRAHTASAPKATKVLSNEDTDAEPINAEDDPLEVVTKAAAALLHDTSHRCRMQAAGNSGPGWSRDITTEVAGSDRLRVQSMDDGQRGETICIGNDGYRKVGAGPWARIESPEMTWYQSHLNAIKLPDELKFGYKSGDLKLIGSESINGSPTFHYRIKIRDTAIDRTVDIWVGGKDSLPRRTEMTTHDLQMKTSWHQMTECTYGTSITIEPPL